MKIFVGSSSESIEIAEEIARIIEKEGHKPFLWKDYFTPGDFTFEKIMDLPDVADAGIFIFAPDDNEQASEKNFQYVPRDNVLVEAGLMFGRLGRHHVALCGVSKAKIPSNFGGMTYIQYEPERKHKSKDKIVQWLKNIPDPLHGHGKPLSVFLFGELPDFDILMASAREEIIISSFFIGQFQRSNALAEAIKRGIKVKLLFADYWGKSMPAMVTMLDGLNADADRVKLKLKNTVQALMKYADNLPDNLEIRLADYVFPNRMTILDPDSDHAEMYIHISSYRNATRPVATFHLTKKEFWFNTYKEEFKSVWKDARPLDFAEAKRYLALP